MAIGFGRRDSSASAAVQKDALRDEKAAPCKQESGRLVTGWG
jgi:hypothetical protein